MDHMQTEEEQVAALKKWWVDNGNALLIGVALALAGIFGWKTYQQNIVEQKEQASAMYFDLTDAALKTQQSSDEETAKKQADDIHYLASQLIEKFPESEYATYAKLFQAKQFVVSGELANAEEVLTAIDMKEMNQAMTNVVNVRLARVKAGLEKYDEALNLLNVSTSDDFYGYNEELKGDILKMKGDKSGAKAAYEKALNKAKELSQPTQLIQIKIDDLAGA